MAEQAQEWLPQLDSALAAPANAPSRAPLLQTSSITGSVFRDLDSDGTNDAVEPLLLGISGVTVTAYDTSGAQVGQTTVSPTTGQYLLTATGNGPFRLEFTGLPDWLYETVFGPDSGTSVQFANDSDVIDLGVHNPEQYCEADPAWVTSCFVNGDSLLTSGEISYCDAIMDLG